MQRLSIYNHSSPSFRLLPSAKSSSAYILAHTGHCLALWNVSLPDTFTDLSIHSMSISSSVKVRFPFIIAIPLWYFSKPILTQQQKTCGAYLIIFYLGAMCYMYILVSTGVCVRTATANFPQLILSLYYFVLFFETIPCCVALTAWNSLWKQG